MGQRNWAWARAAAIAMVLSACDDEIVDLGLSKDAAAERAPDASSDATREGGNDTTAPDASEPEEDAADATEGDAASERSATDAQASDGQSDSDGPALDVPVDAADEARGD